MRNSEGAGASIATVRGALHEGSAAGASGCAGASVWYVTAAAAQQSVAAGRAPEERATEAERVRKREAGAGPEAGTKEGVAAGRGSVSVLPTAMV
jgi:hypothetical protein